MPGLRVDRTGAAIIGAALMVAANVLSIEDAYRAIHLDTIVLLFGMMIVVANLRVCGFFALAGEWTVERAHHPLTLLVAVAMISAALSAFFVNDIVCVVMAPLVAEVVTGLHRNPVPYLLAVAMASNAGSVATLTGNPQNMLIGSYSGISYNAFASALAPVAVVSVVAVIVVLALLYRDEFRCPEKVQAERRPVNIHRPLMMKTLTVSTGMVVFFFAGWPLAKVAIVGGALLLITRRVKPERIYAEIDWSLLVLFAGLFVVVAGLENSPLRSELAQLAARAHLSNAAVLTGLSAVLSNIVSNVPAVLVFHPFMAHLTNPELGWLRLAMSSTLAGNLTIFGSVANLIVVERSRGVARIGFWEYARAGLPVGIITLALGAWMLR
jgi:Na+/H+ antiporter NhaD/arsenite permease-like protein